MKDLVAFSLCVHFPLLQVGNQFGHQILSVSKVYEFLESALLNFILKEEL
jgi:hypothetical protein